MEGQLAHIVSLPDDAIPIFTVELVAYLDHEGEPNYRTRIDGDVRYGELIGALRIMEHDTLMQRYTAEDGDGK